MARGYSQLTLKERKEIEEGLDRGDSFREIARLIGRSPSTISREVRENRCIRSMEGRRRQACRDRDRCSLTNICAECVGRASRCSSCGARDCRDHCGAFTDQHACNALAAAPWVCNGCPKNRFGCSRRNRYAYKAAVADKAAGERRSDSRKGIDMPEEKADFALALVRDGLSRGLSPYEVSELYADEIGVHPSTIYRWVAAGYGGLTNLELERKVGFRPRKKRPVARTTSHSPKRSHESFLALGEEARRSRSEIDCVIGRNADTQAILTVYNLPCHVQLAMLLGSHDCESVKKELANLKKVMPGRMWARWMGTALTDNGEEFCDEDGIGALLGERSEGDGLKVHLYYCDPRQSQQKGGCEKNHTELRQILRKGMFCFDELNGADMAALMSHVNSNPRESLGGKTPMQMLRFVYGERDANDLLDALGIREIGRDELMLKPEILDIERARRGEAPLTRLR